MSDIDQRVLEAAVRSGPARFLDLADRVAQATGLPLRVVERALIAMLQRHDLEEDERFQIVSRQTGYNVDAKRDARQSADAA